MVRKKNIKETEICLNLNAYEWEVIRLALEAPIRSQLVSAMKEIAGLDEDETLIAWDSVTEKFNESWPLGGF